MTNNEAIEILERVEEYDLNSCMPSRDLLEFLEAIDVAIKALKGY